MNSLASRLVGQLFRCMQQYNTETFFKSTFSTDPLDIVMSGKILWLSLVTVQCLALAVQPGYNIAERGMAL